LLYVREKNITGSVMRDGMLGPEVKRKGEGIGWLRKGIIRSDSIVLMEDI
jgi:hypothetical protein